MDTMIKIKRSTKNDLLILKAERDLRSMNDVIEELILTDYNLKGVKR